MYDLSTIISNTKEKYPGISEKLHNNLQIVTISKQDKTEQITTSPEQNSVQPQTPKFTTDSALHSRCLHKYKCIKQIFYRLLT